jgi:predicted DNA binding CopG/RHH family protein
VPTQGKTRITTYLDDQIVAAFKAESARTGIGYQMLINEVLAQHIGTAEKPEALLPLRR